MLFSENVPSGLRLWVPGCQYPQKEELCACYLCFHPSIHSERRTVQTLRFRDADKVPLAHREEPGGPSAKAGPGGGHSFSLTTGTLTVRDVFHTGT